MEIQQVCDEYLCELRDLRRYSQLTVTAYTNDLKGFIEFCSLKNKTAFNLITQKIIKSYLIYLNEQGLEKRSISRKLSAIRGLFRFGYSKGYAEINPAGLISNPKNSRNLPEVAPLDSIMEIYDIADRTDEDAVLVKVIFELLYGCALRVAELCSLNRYDIDLKENIVKVKGKRNKIRIVPVGEKSVLVVSDYLTDRKNFFKNILEKNQPLLINKKGKRIYPRLVYRIVNKYLRKVSDIKKKSPHILRHSAATHMLDRGADLNAVKEILGHENLSTTQIYTHVSVERLKKTYKKAHPKS